jgi:uncharacterized protein YndB with AHSA1/START domain
MRDRRSWLLAAAALLLTPFAAPAETRSLPLSGFAFELEATVAGSPEQAFDAFTRDTIEWWDHHFSAKPKRLFFEARPGGGFFEIFDDEGNGVRHATVIYAERGKRLRFVGALGLAGNAVEMVHTLDFGPAESGTRLRLAVQAMGAIQEGWPAAVEGVWKHFLVERFQPHMASRAAKAAGP